MNLTSRIESYTVGGQILISESTVTACGPILRIDSQLEIMPKGVREPITIYEVGGIGGDYHIFLPAKQPIELQQLQRPVTVEFTILEGKYAGRERHKGVIRKMADRIAEMQADVSADKLNNLKIWLCDDQNKEISADLYAKVIEVLSESPPEFRINFTSVPPEADAFFKRCLTLSATEG